MTVNYFINLGVNLMQNILWLPNEYSIHSYADYRHGLLKVAKYTEDGLLYGLFDLQLHEVIEVMYKDIQFFEHETNIFRVQLCDSRYAYINRHNEWIVSPDNFFIPEINRLWAPDYPCDNRIKVGSTDLVNRKYGFVDFQGTLAVALQYDDVFRYSQGIAVVESKGKYGYIDLNGNQVVACIYEFCRTFKYNIGVIGVGELCGAVNIYGESILEPQYKEIIPYWDNLMIVSMVTDSYTKYGIYTASGKQLVAFHYDEIRPYHMDGYLPVLKDKLWGLLNKDGIEVLPCKYSDISFIDNEGFVEVTIGKRKRAFIHLDGHQITGYTNYLFGFKEGLCPVKKKKWGFVDKQGIIVIPIAYLDVTSFNQGLARVQDINGKFGCINKNNEFVIQPVYDWIYPFDGYCYTTVRQIDKLRQNQEGLISNKGEILLPIQYKEVINTKLDGVVIIKDDTRNGIIKIRESKEDVVCLNS